MRLAEEGALVSVHYGRSKDAAEEVVRLIEQNGGAAFALGLELNAAKDVKALYDALDDALIQRTGDYQFDILYVK